MKKKYIIFLLICLIATGCATPQKVIELTPTSYKVLEGNEITVIENKENEVPKVELSFSEDEYRGGLYYNQLSSDEKLIYDELYVTFRDRLSGVKIDTLDTNLIEKAGFAVIYDHPELFYLSNYSYTVFSNDGIPQYITVDGMYSVDDENLDVYQNIIDDYVMNATAGLSQNDSDYDKILFVYDYIISNTEYDMDAPDNQTMLSVCETGRSVCTGYAKTFQYIMHKLGIECELITGYSLPSNERHAWNIVKVNDQYYNIDTTWGEGAYIESAESVSLEYLDPVNYSYFLVPDEWIKKTHIPESGYVYPECLSEDLSYFTVNGLLIDSINSDKLHQIFDEAYINNYSNVKIKTTTDELFDELMDYFIENRNITRYITETGSIYYVPDELNNTFIVLLK